MAEKLPPTTEAHIHRQVAEYLRWQHPKIIFHTDFAAGARMSWGLIQKNNAVQGKRGFPDLFLAEPAPKKDGSGNWSGLFLELKREGVKIFKKDGVTFISEHFKEQYEMLEELQEKNFYSVFSFGFEQSKKIIEAYLQGKR